MKFEILNPQGSYAVLKASLNQGDEFYSMPGSVLSLRGINFGSQRKGGILGGLKRKILTGTNIYMDSLYFESPPGEAIVSPLFPGQIAGIQLNEEVFTHSHSFLAAESGVEIGSKMLGVRSLLASGELFWITLRPVNSTGAWISFFGDIIKMDIPQGETISIDHGHFVAINASASFRIRWLGIKRALLGGEGFYMVDITGPATLWLQSRNLDAFVQMVASSVGGGANRTVAAGAAGAIIGGLLEGGRL